MCWTVLFCLLLINLASHHVCSALNIQRRESNLYDQDNPSDYDGEGLPTQSEELPVAEPIAPGHTLLQPSLGMLMSAVKFPQKEDEMLVYGNLNNLGITYGKTKERILYTGFRKFNDLLDILLKPTINKHLRKPILAFEEENNASEILDDEELFGNANDDFRRKDNRKYRERESSESTELDSSSASGSSDYERNPGNPYTVFKDKYLQNWMWNHVMDGNHMNVNPYAPAFTSVGPSGAALFFNRKWWYYNQDDYRPFD